MICAKFPNITHSQKFVGRIQFVTTPAQLVENSRNAQRRTKNPVKQRFLFLL